MNAIPHEIRPAIKQIANEVNAFGNDTETKLKEMESQLMTIVEAMGVGIEVATLNGEAQACTQELGYGVAYLMQMIKASQEIRQQLNQ